MSLRILETIQPSKNKKKAPQHERQLPHRTTSTTLGPRSPDRRLPPIEFDTTNAHTEAELAGISSFASLVFGLEMWTSTLVLKKNERMRAFQAYHGWTVQPTYRKRGLWMVKQAIREVRKVDADLSTVLEWVVKHYQAPEGIPQTS